MNDRRPSPDELLARVQAEDEKIRRGRLKIFFGSNAGVGKTFAMLKEAQSRRAEHIDLVVGVVETHGRAETQALLENLEILPRHPIEYHGATLYEFDLDAALARKPALLLVDELAHTNAPESRHAKRWQDVDELLAAGIDVYTTLNVQHLESLGDVVASITGVQQHEMVPDIFFDHAEEVMIIDLPPEQLHERLRQGKVYQADAAGRAAENFFRKGNLIALRELALRRTAERVDAQMRDYRTSQAITTTWAAGERLLVGVGPSPFSTRLVRATRRMAASLHSPWLAVFVETPAAAKLSPDQREGVHQTLRLAEQLGAETTTLSGEDFTSTLLDFAREQNVTKIVVGKPQQNRWHDRFRKSVVDDLIWRCGDIDIYVITGDEARPVSAAKFGARQPGQKIVWMSYVKPALLIAFLTVVCHLLVQRFTPATFIMFYLVAVIFTAFRWGRGPSIFASILSVATFDFFLVPPYFTFAVTDTQYVLTFFIMLGTGILISGLVTRLRTQAQIARQRERNTSVLYELTRELANVRDQDDLLAVAIGELSKATETQCALFLPGSKGEPVRPWIEVMAPFASDPKELSVAQWVFDHAQPAGRGTQTLPSAQALYLPLQGASSSIGVLAVRDETSQFIDPERLRFLETIARQTAQALERERLLAEARTAQLRLETEQIRNTLLTSVSHELRTPLTVISGSAESLLEKNGELPPTARHEFVQTIYDEADRLDRLVQNLLQMSRLEAGMIQLRKEWHVIEELVGNALHRLEHFLNKRPVKVSLPADLPLIEVDGLLIEQVLINLLENAAKYTPNGSEIEISGGVEDGKLKLRILDEGPGIDSSNSQSLFQPFVQGSVDFSGIAHPSRRGVGLGLALSAAVIRLHGGEIWVHNRPERGAEFGFSLTLSEKAPMIDSQSENLTT